MAADSGAGAVANAAGAAARGEEAGEGERRRPAPEKGREAAGATARDGGSGGRRAPLPIRSHGGLASERRTRYRQPRRLHGAAHLLGATPAEDAEESGRGGRVRRWERRERARRRAGRWAGRRCSAAASPASGTRHRMRVCLADASPPASAPSAAPSPAAPPTPLNISSCRLPSVPVWSRAPMGAPGEGSAASGIMGREGSSYGMRVAAATARRRLRSPLLRVPARPPSPLVAALARRCLPPAPLSNAPPACLSAVGTRSHARPPLPRPACFAAADSALRRRHSGRFAAAATTAALPSAARKGKREEERERKRMMLTRTSKNLAVKLRDLG
uniref:Uncharacterized protein n=1 Tax=Oryza sativa subsp. japonica TaxID=39947 RepID=Q6EN31_ORYSJ|nr:hypothetical protein [Oryza sativa Japonica Group]BAD29704.1 hypothetical protein [Oryza sativa Japonica Group]